MKKTSYITLLAICLILFATTAFAVDGTYRLRDLADSEFRIAEKTYRTAVKHYGESLKGMSAEEKASMCKKLGYALHDNKVRYSMEDIFAQAKYKRQVQKLEQYSNAVGCTN